MHEARKTIRALLRVLFCDTREVPELVDALVRVVRAFRPAFCDRK
jgi:hypothetical protein